MKKRILLVALVLVAIASTIGVGFASWVISRPATETEKGSFYVETVTDESLHLVITAVDDVTEFSFYGPAQGGNNSQAWLQYEDTVLEGRRFENLGVAFKIEVQKNNPAHATDNEADEFIAVDSAYTLHLEFAEGILDGQTFVVQANTAKAINQAGADHDLVSGATYATNTDGGSTKNAVAGTQVKVDNSDVLAWKLDITTNASGVAYIFINYAWGSHFTVGENTVNPYTYYNQQGINADTVKVPAANESPAVTYADDAQTQLAALYDQVKPVSFQLTVNVSAADKVVPASNND